MSKIFRCKTDEGYHYTTFNLKRLDLNIEEWDSVGDVFNIFKSLYIGKADDGHGLTHILSVYNRSLDIWKKVVDMGVVDETMTMAIERQELPRRARMFMLAAMVHDLFSESHRETHHVEAYEFVKAMRNRLNMFGTKNLQYIKLKTNTDVSNKINLWLDTYGWGGDRAGLTQDLTTVMYMVFRHRSSIPYNTPAPEDDFKIPYLPDDDMVRAFRAGDKDEPDLEVLLNRLVTVTVHDKKSVYKLPIDETFKHLNRNVFQGKDLLSKDDLIKIKYHLIDKFGRKGYAYRDMDVTDPYYLYHGTNLELMFDNIYFIEQTNMMPSNTEPDKDLELYLNSIYPHFKVLFNHINMNYPRGLTESDLDLELLSNSVGENGLVKDGISNHVLKRVTSGGEDDVIVAKLYMDGKTIDLVTMVKFIRELYPNVLIVINSNNDLLVDFSVKPEAYLF